VSFADVRYQDTAVRVLRAAVAGDRVAHAYLFAGPRGVGKGRVAREFAKLLFCESPRGKTAQTLDPCDNCDHCRRVDRGVHPDLYWFRKEPDRNDFRLCIVTRREGNDADSPSTTVIESVMLTPMETDFTVTVLDDAEYLNRPAASALLKSLEEPSPRAVLILLCADASQLPGTILSRCQWVRFGPLPEEFVAKKVREALAAKAEEAPARGRKAAPRPEVSAEEIAFVCRFAGGSIEQAGRLAGTGLWDLKRTLLEEVLKMGPAEALDAAAAIDAWARGQVKEAHVRAESPEANAIRRWASRLALAAVASAFGDAAVLAATGKAAGLVNADQRPTIEALAAWSAESAARAVDILAEAQAQIDRYVHTELATENALVQVSRLRPAAT
jgi:DNA polymerase III delta prime subunit